MRVLKLALIIILKTISINMAVAESYQSPVCDLHKGLVSGLTPFVEREYLLQLVNAENQTSVRNRNEEKIQRAFMDYLTEKLHQEKWFNKYQTWLTTSRARVGQIEELGKGSAEAAKLINIIKEEEKLLKDRLTKHIKDFFRVTIKRRGDISLPWAAFEKEMMSVLAGEFSLAHKSIFMSYISDSMTGAVQVCLSSLERKRELALAMEMDQNTQDPRYNRLNRQISECEKMIESSKKRHGSKSIELVMADDHMELNHCFLIDGRGHCLNANFEGISSPQITVSRDDFKSRIGKENYMDFVAMKLDSSDSFQIPSQCKAEVAKLIINEGRVGKALASENPVQEIKSLMEMIQ